MNRYEYLAMQRVLWRVVMLFLWSVLAFGQTVELAGGEPEFGCLETSDCPNFYSFLSEAMIEQGFVFQNASMLTSPLNLNDGWVFAASATTFPFSGERENLSGKTENTSYSPVLPKLHVGRVGMVGDRARLGTGLSFVPPVPVGGASALLVGADISVTTPISQVWSIGLEGDLTYARARAPIVASDEQFENADDYNGNLNAETFETVCSEGCVDTFTLLNPGLRVSLMAHLRRFTFAVEPGVNYVNETLEVEYDATVWKARGWQPSLNVEGGFAVSESVSLGLGSALALRGSNIDNSAPYFNLMGQVGFNL